MTSGKPKDIAEKMVQGRLQKFYQEVVLNEQISVIDGETKIKDIIKKLSNDLNTEVHIKDFKILKLGEGIEVAENDFAAEVAAASEAAAAAAAAAAASAAAWYGRKRFTISHDINCNNSDN